MASMPPFVDSRKGLMSDAASENQSKEAPCIYLARHLILSATSRRLAFCQKMPRDIVLRLATQVFFQKAASTS